MEQIVNIGVVGIGNMGSAHGMSLYKNKVKGCKLAAVCDSDEKRLQWAKSNLKGVKCFNDYHELINSGIVNAIVVATPHPMHPVIVEEACKNGIHVLTEKPAGVDVKTVAHMNQVAKESGVVFSIMYNQRTNPLYKELRRVFQNGNLGQLIRFNWIINNWYRTDAYYASGDWRATWDGEGGGVLMNQCPHNLDIWQWITGMPIRIRAFCHKGLFHPIDVEDSAEIFAEYENGAIGIFQTSTGEYPGTNRMEISGTRGKAVIENGKLTITLLKEDLMEYTKNSKEFMPKIDVDESTIIQEEPESAHIGILQNFSNAIRKGEPLISPGEEGIYGLSLANAAYLSWWKNDFVNLPLDEDEYLHFLQSIKNSNHEKHIKTLCEDGSYGEYSNRWKVKW